MADESIIGFEGLLMSKGIRSGRKKNRIRKLIYDKYGKDNLQCIYRQRLAKSSHKNRTPDDYRVSPEQRTKMAVGIRKSWKDADLRREQNRKFIIDVCAPKSHTSLANKKRIESRKNGEGWNPHSETTKKVLSNIFKLKWQRGDYDNRPACLKSKGQLEICSLLEDLGYDVVPEYRVYDKPFDAGIPSCKILIEFNGTYWHLDPREYEYDYYDKYRKAFAYQIWKRDMEKTKEAERRGYKVVSIWQIDWDACKDKRRYLREVMNGTN